jgi:photosystem II stability/assembly factor-like uncharacterized protein
MKGDFTRNTFRPERRYSGVRLQQGRVQVDADFNEQVDIGAHLDRTTTRDAIGRRGAPAAGAGFALFPTLFLAAIDSAAGVVRAVGQQGTLLAITDHGKKWTPEPRPAGFHDDLYDVEVVDANVAFAVGAGPAVLKRDGSDWAKQTLPSDTEGVLRGVSFGTATRGCIVGDGGQILVTSNGSTWQRKQAAGVTEPLHAVHLVDQNRGCAVGASGRIIATQDGGQSWSVQDPPPGFASTLRAVFFTNAKTGWCVGDGASILSTADGGETWTERAAPAGVAETLRGVHARDDLVWAVGDRGTVLRSQNGGAAWDEFPADGSDLADVHALDGAVLACGDLATIVRSEGVSGEWTQASLPEPLPARDLGISAGRMYLDGILCEQQRPLRYLEQPDLPDAPVPEAEGCYLAYLDVWERHVTALEHADLREVALGGPDTATRTQIVCQVRLQPVEADSCSEFGHEWSPEPTGPRGRLRARGEPGAEDDDDCVVPLEGGYRRLENQLYRVEMVAPGEPGGASFVWSRDNGAMAARLVRIEAADGGRSRLILSSAGRDRAGGFEEARYVELSDGHRLLHGEPGSVFEVESVAGNTVTIKHEPSSASELGELSGGATVRRWDGYGTVEADGWLPLEDGVEVQFSPGRYSTGDHWTIPARTNTATVEWASDDGAPRFELRHGTEHHYCPLALVDLGADGVWKVDDDCRRRFPPLVEVSHLFYVGGDGQEAMPQLEEDTVAFPLPLQVGVANRTGASVRFEVVDAGTGPAFLSSGGQKAPRIEVLTDEDGIASCTWHLDAKRPVQQVEAVLLDPRGHPLPLPVRFTGRLGLASEVAYDPDGCELLVDARNVQEAITGLCRAIRERPASSLRLELTRTVLRNVDDPAGRWQYEGGRASLAGGRRANYASTKRIVFGATDQQNTAMLTATFFLLGEAPPENITLQGAHDFGSGGQIGSVSAASPEFAHLIGQPFRRVRDTVHIGEVVEAPLEEILLEPRRVEPDEVVRLVVALAAVAEEATTVRLTSSVEVPGLPQEVTIEPGADRAVLELRAPAAEAVPPEGLRIVITGRAEDRLRRRTLIIGE